MKLSSQVLAVVGVMTITAAFAAVLPNMLDGGARAFGDDEGPVALAGSERTTFNVESHVDDATIPITIYRPLAADASNQVPVLLHSHGWSGSRTNSDGAFAKYVDNGFGVVSIDMRGHGASKCVPDCVARVHNVGFEIQDVRDVIDHVATLPWVKLEAPGDPLLGALGGSYGGGYQLLTAAFDPRLDAIAPEITWNSLPQSLAPNGAVKSDWVHLLYAATHATNTKVHDNIHKAYAEAMATNSFPDGTGPTGVDVVSWFTASSPAAYPESITIPTLLIQGMPDTLFNLNQAVANFQQISDDAPVWLFAHRTGHILSTAGTIPVPSPVPIGIQPPGQGSPCGDVSDLILAFYTDKLKGGLPFTQSAIEMAFDDGSCREFQAWPPTGLTDIPVADAVAVPSAPVGPKLLLPLVEVAAPSPVLAGIPTVTFTPLDLDDSTIYFSLVAGSADGLRVLDAQVTPFRHRATDAAGAVTLDLGGVASVIGSDETLFLQISTWDEQFATNGDRVPEAAALLDVSVGLPVL